MKKFSYILSFFLVLSLFSSCTRNEPENIYLSENEALGVIKGGKLLNLNDLKQAPYMSEAGNYCDSALYRLRSTGVNNPAVHLFSIDTITTQQGPLYIRGRVTTDDVAGNFYKLLCLQQMVDGEQQAIRIAIDASSISGMYPIGQELLIRVDGLCIGRYGNQPQLCVPTYNNNIYAQNYTEKVGWTPGRIPYGIFQQRAQKIGMPDKALLHYDTLTISDFVGNVSDEVANRLDDARLVCIKDVHFTGEYVDYGEAKTCTVGDPKTDGNANVFAPTTKNFGYPQSRVISDGSSSTLVSTSEYAKYARFYLPGANSEGCSACAEYVGNVVGILGYYRDDNYNDKSKNKPSWDKWSISIRSLDDLQLYRSGQLWQRLEYGSTL